MRRFRITHTTSYAFRRRVSGCRGEARLWPRALPWQQTEFAQIVVRPLPAERTMLVDGFGNRVCRFELRRPFMRLEVTGLCTVVRHVPPDPASHGNLPWEAVRDVLRDGAADAVAPFREPSPRTGAVTGLGDYAAASFPTGRPMLEAAADLMHRIHADFAYAPGETDVDTPVNTVFERRVGVCQDFTHLALACLRSLGLAARYVSGYVDTSGVNADVPRRIGCDLSHAWFSVFVPDFGWVDFDPTNDRIPGDEYVALAWGCDYDDVCPLSGTFTGGPEHRLHVSVDIQPVPPSDEQNRERDIISTTLLAGRIRR